MSEPPVILSQFAEGAWAIPGAMPSARKQTEISWHNSIVDNNDRVHLSQTGNKYVIHPRLDDAEVAGFEAAAIELLLDGDHDGMRRTPGPGHQAVSDQREGGEQLQMEGYNAWSGTNFMSGLINRAAIIDSPQKFSGRLSLTPLSIGPFVALKQPSSPEAVCGMQESKFVDKVIKTFSLVQDKSESPVDLSNKHADRESVLRELRASLLSLKPGENNISSCEAQNSYERDKEQADGPDCPMTAHAKVACKDFVREFRRLERLSAEQAQEYAESALESVPASARWRVHLQMADLAKRLNKEEEATEHYKEACKLEPTASKSWLEWSKMQDECGSTELALQTVLQGIVAKSAADTDCTRFDEVLLLRALRLYEKQNRLADARRLIFSACWSQLGVDRVWRVLFEGAQMEARAGNIARARCLFEFLMDHVPWYGPIYSEALRLEETGGHITSCLRIIRRGLLELRRYGPLWFGLLRMMERMDFEAEKRSWATTGSHPQLVNVKLYLPLAVINISGELVWKLYFELGQIEERAVSISAEGRAWMASEDDRCGSDDMASFRDALLGPARKAYLDSLLSCPSNLRWKVLLAGARMELSAGKIDISRDLFSEAMAVVPLKSRAHVQIECARLEEFLYNFDVAREILVMGRSDMPGEWKICLELAMHYMRGRRYCAAVESLVSAVDLHSNAGRIWALLLQLIPCAWNEDTLRMKNSMWSLFEKSNLFFNFLKCLCPLEDSKYESEGYEANYKSSIESLDLTDTEKSFESTGLVKECMKTRVVGVMPQSLLESLRQMRSVHRLVSLLALEEVPKSGECWCEAARLALNPMGYATEFDLALAHRYLSYAVLFTPQYGDSFIERIRLELLRQIMLPDILACLGIGFQCFYKTIFNCDVQDADEDLQLILRSLDCRELSPKEWMQQSGNSFKSYRKRRSLEVEKLYEMSSEIGYCGDHFRKIVLSRLYQSCVNAEPNYGTAWFYFREKTTDEISEILGEALEAIIHEFCATQDIYIRAVSQFVYKSIKNRQRDLSSGVGMLMSMTCNCSSECYCCLHNQKSVDTFIEDYERGMKRIIAYSESCEIELCTEVGGGSIFLPSDFTCGLIELSRSMHHFDLLQDENRRRHIFCSDQVMP